MDWALAISRNRNALLTIVAAIVALIGGREGGPIARRIRNAALALLRPAESATRRLIVIAARGLTASPGTARPPIGGAAAPRPASRERTPAFPLFDRRKRYILRLPLAAPRGIPRIRTFWGAPFAPAAPPPALVLSPSKQALPDPDAMVDARRLRLRLRSLEAALADLPRQARRLARWRARRACEAPPLSPLRLGRPPGHRLRPDREIDVVLRECHALALDALRADTS
jgi:hypothetical protein